jgi:hypothetical protein
LFADDTNLFVSAKNIQDLENKANIQITRIYEWLKANKLHLNKDKTCYAVFSPTQFRAPDLNIKVNNVRLQRVESCKYLGVIIDEELKWTSHIEAVLSKLKQLVGICYKIRYKLPDWCLRNIYFAYVHSRVLYGIEVYGNTFASYLDKLTKLNNTLLRILQKKGRCCTNCLYFQYNTVPPTQLFNYQILNLVHKSVISPELLPPIFENYFVLNKTVHDYNTRIINFICLKPILVLETVH